MSRITIITRVEKIHAAEADRRNFFAHTGRGSEPIRTRRTTESITFTTTTTTTINRLQKTYGRTFWQRRPLERCRNQRLDQIPKGAAHRREGRRRNQLGWCADDR